MNVIKCKKCGKKFAYEIFGDVYPGCKEKEEAQCPYCGEIGYSVMTSQCIAVYKIDENDNIIENETEEKND